MAIQIQGFSSAALIEVDGLGFRGQRYTNRPTDYSTLGHYSLGVETGILPAGLAANSQLFHFRWTSSTVLAVIQKVTVAASVSTTFFAAGVPVQVDLVRATAWNVQGSGGTGITMGATLKERTSMASSAAASGDIRIATTTGLTVGTANVETTNSMGMLVAAGPIGGTDPVIIQPGTELIRSNVADGTYPLVLTGTNNEGFIVRAVAVPATGTWTMSVHVHWAEVSAY